METEQRMRIFCKMDTTLNLAVRGDKVLLVPADFRDKSQHWIQDYSAIGNLTDDEGGRAFALVNRTTGQAMVNTTVGVEVKLAPYSGHVAVEVSKLWSLGEQCADGFSHIRMLQADCILYALHPIKHGTVVGTYPPAPYDHTFWKIVPINEQ